MTAPVIQPSFAAGELSPTLYGRVDLEKFHKGAALLQNFFVDYRGGASNRPGTEYVCPCLPGINRVIPFQFSTLQTYSLVFSDKAMRVVMDGALVVEDTPVFVTGIVTADPYRLLVLTSIPPQPMWNPGDWIFVSPSVVPPSGSVGRFAGAFMTIIDIVGGNAYEMAEFTGEPIDGTVYSAIGGGAGAIQRVYTLTTPYAAADLALLKFTQSADTMTLCHPNYPPMQLTRTAHNAWTLTAISFTPAQPTPITPIATPSAPGGTTIYRYVITSVAKNAVTESLPSVPATAVNSQAMSATAGASVILAWAYDPAAAPQLFNVYRQAEVRNGAPDGNQLYGFVGTIMSDGSGFGSFIDCNINPDFTLTPPQDPNVMKSAGEYPGCTSYYQQRQGFAGSLNKPQTIFFSKTADFLNMQYSSPSRPDDAIVATLVAKEVNAIEHLVSMDALVAFTTHAAFKIDAGSAGGAVTPSSLEVSPQAYNGCSHVPPIVINQDILYVQAKGSMVRDLAWNYFVKVYTGNDLSVLSGHLFAGHQIVEWAYAEEPFKLIWAVRDDGLLLIFAYLKEQDVYAWSHAISDGQFKSVCSISEGNEDAVYFVVQRQYKSQTVQFVERLSSRLLGANPELGVPADFTKFRFLDSALATDLNYPAATLTVNSGEMIDGEGWWDTPRIYDVGLVAGGAGYSAAAKAVIRDETGSGAAIFLTITAGVITGALVTAQGSNYINPTIEIEDATGAGAVLHARLSRDVEFIADAPVMGGVAPGFLFVGNGGFGYVRAINSARSMTVDMHQPLANNFPLSSGKWSATARVTAVHGLDHLEGRKVSILADGNVLDSQTVIQGAVAIPAPGAASIVVGLPYSARMESLYLDTGEQPTSQGRRKALPHVSVRVADTRGVKVGIKGCDFMEMKERRAEQMGDPIRPFTGDRKVSVPTTFDYTPQVVVQQDYPLPASVLALIPHVTTVDTPTR